MFTLTSTSWTVLLSGTVIVLVTPVALLSGMTSGVSVLVKLGVVL